MSKHAERISTERLITSRQGFGIETASPCQRAACRILDGLPLGELASDLDVIRFVGGSDALAALPSERGIQPLEVVFLAAIRSLKTIMATAAAIRMSQTVDVSRLGTGEIARVSIVSLKLDTSGVAFRILAETVKARPLLKQLLIGEPTADSLMLRHPSGRPIEICCVAGAKAGSGLVARWSAGVIFDEAPRMVGSEDGIVNLDDSRRAVLGRLLPGAQALYIGSPWAPFGPVYDLTQEFWKRPTEEIVVIRGTGPVLNPYWWTPERCARLQRQDSIAYRTDVEGEFADPESTLFASDVLERQTRREPVELPPDPALTYAAAMDPATRGNAWTLVVTCCTGMNGVAKQLSVVLARQWVGSRIAPLSPEATLGEIAAVLKPYGLTMLRTDQWSADALRDIARRVGLNLIFEDVTAAKKLELYEGLRLRLENGELELPPVPLLREDLTRVRKRLTSSGFTIVLPTTGDGRHADYAPALALAASAILPAPRRPEPEIPEAQQMREAERARVRRLSAERWQRNKTTIMRRSMGLS